LWYENGKEHGEISPEDQGHQGKAGFTKMKCSSVECSKLEAQRSMLRKRPQHLIPEILNKQNVQLKAAELKKAVKNLGLTVCSPGG
jgi:hypothetical protein